MPDVPTHPDRAAATLANLPAGCASATWAPPGPDAADVRLPDKMLQWRARRAAARSPAAAAWLAALPPERHPDLWAGTVQDGVARGFAVRLEEAIALAPADPAPDDLAAAPGARVFAGRELRKKKDLLVASGGSRVRFSRKEGLLFVARDDGLHSPNCLRFEARSDRGSLDVFGPAADERPRLFSAQFLQPVRYVETAAGHELRLAGRLGRGPNGWDVALTITGRAAANAVTLRLVIDNRQRDVRLRARFLGLPLAAIHHECTPVHEVVANDAGGFIAFTLVRAIGTLRVGDHVVATPAAQCPGPLEHVFHLGAAID